jgi:hypothetical protein
VAQAVRQDSLAVAEKAATLVEQAVVVTTLMEKVELQGTLLSIT